MRCKKSLRCGQSDPHGSGCAARLFGWALAGGGLGLVWVGLWMLGQWLGRIG